jgi:hypothetical protein
MKEYGFYVEEDIIVCPKCATNPEYVGLLTPVEEEGYPDGFTCDDCSTVIAGNGESEVA